MSVNAGQDFRPDRERDHRPVLSAGPAAARGCRCGKRMLEHLNEGTCLWCGYGRAHAVVEHAYQRNMEDNAFRAEPAQAAPIPIVRWTEDACVLAYRRWTAANGRTPSPADWMGARVDGEPARPTYQTIRARFGDWHGFLRYIAHVPREQAA